MTKQLMIYDKLFVATAQGGSFTCGAAAVCNAYHFLTGRPLAEFQLRSKVKAPMVTHGIANKASALYYGDDETGAPGSLKLLDEEKRAMHFDSRTHKKVRLNPYSTEWTQKLAESGVYNLAIPTGTAADTYLAPSDKNTTIEGELDPEDLQPSIKGLGLNYATDQISPAGVLERLKQVTATSVYIAGVKWTTTIEEEGGGHWVAVVHYEAKDTTLIVLDSISGVEQVKSCPTYVQSGNGERGFFDGWLMKLSPTS